MLLLQLALKKGMSCSWGFGFHSGPGGSQTPKFQIHIEEREQKVPPYRTE